MAPHIFLHGGSSAGKTTLARVLQQVLPAEYLYLSWDHFVEVVPARCREPGYEVPDAVASRMVTGFHAMLGAFARAGNPLVIETLGRKPEWRAELFAALGEERVLFVGVECAEEELVRREAERGDRPLGLALAQARQARELSGGDYDLLVDTSQVTTEVAARLILAGLESDRGAFQRFLLR